MSDKIWSSKKDFQELLLSIVEPLKPYYSEEKARLLLGVTATNYDRKAETMEAFSRPLWGLVPFWAGGGTEAGFEEIYRLGLVAGTDPTGDEFWGGFHAFDQKFVEMAAISYGLILTPGKLWDPLSDREKERLADWLYGINQYELPVCNWILFAVLVNVALMKLGRKYDAGKLEKYLQVWRNFIWETDGIRMGIPGRRIIMFLLLYIFTAFSMRGSWEKRIRKDAGSTRNAPCFLEKPSFTGLMKTGRRCPSADPLPIVLPR